MFSFLVSGSGRRFCLFSDAAGGISRLIPSRALSSVDYAPLGLLLLFATRQKCTGDLCNARRKNHRRQSCEDMAAKPCAFTALCTAPNFASEAMIIPRAGSRVAAHCAGTDKHRLSRRWMQQGMQRLRNARRRRAADRANVDASACSMACMSALRSAAPRRAHEAMSSPRGEQQRNDRRREPPATMRFRSLTDSFDDDGEVTDRERGSATSTRPARSGGRKHR